MLSGAAPVPWRSAEAEAAIVARTLSPEVTARAAEASMQKAKPLAKNEYKTYLFRGVLEEELSAASKP